MPDFKRAYVHAREIQAARLVEDAHKIADGPENPKEDSKVQVARDKLRVGQRHHRAALQDRERFGEQKTVKIENKAEEERVKLIREMWQELKAGGMPGLEAPTVDVEGTSVEEVGG